MLLLLPLLTNEGQGIAACARVVRAGLSLRVATLGVAGQPVVWDRLPRRSVGDELADAGPDPGIAIERSDANADRIGVVRVSAKQRRATVAAEPLLATAVRLPRTEPVLTLLERVPDPERPGRGAGAIEKGGRLTLREKRRRLEFCRFVRRGPFPRASELTPLGTRGRVASYESRRS